MIDVEFHSFYSRSLSSWSLLELDFNFERAIHENRRIWLKGNKIDNQVFTVICTEDEVFLLKREKSSNARYLAIDFEEETKFIQSNKENFSEPLIFRRKFSVIGNLNSKITMIKIPSLTNKLEEFMSEHRNHFYNKHSNIGFEKLFNISQTSIKGLYNYLFSFDSMLYCDLSSKWYSINIEFLIFILCTILEKGMSRSVSFKKLCLKDIRNLIKESFSDLTTDDSIESKVCSNSLKHALSSDLILFQLIKHFIEPMKNSDLGTLLISNFNEMYSKNFFDFSIYERMSFSNITNMKITFSYKRIQKIFALSIIRKKLAIKVKEYVENFQSILSNYVPVEISEIDFNENVEDLKEKDLEVDFYYGFPILENHPDNIGVRFDIIAGNAYYNEEDDEIVYLPQSTLPNDPRKRLSTLFSKKKYWHISELSSFISPILPYEMKLEAFCFQNCYICEKYFFNKKLKLFYNKNLFFK